MRFSINYVLMMTLLLVSNKPLLVFSQGPENFQAVLDIVRNRSANDNSFARTLVRMAFHDAMGGVDALLDRTSSEHNGLMGAFDFLDSTYQQTGSINSVFGKADFFAWSYIAAFYVTCPGYVPSVPLYIGRNTYSSGRNEDVPPNSPFGSGGHAGVLSYFANNFGFNEAEVAIILGAHTLGGADRRNTGFVGDWTRSMNTFNSDYYVVLANPPRPPGQPGGWEQVAVTNGGVTKFQWRLGCTDNGQNCRDLMLNVDMELFYDLDAFFVGRAGQVRLPTGGEIPNTAPAFCSTTTRIYADCFPQRTGTETQRVVTLFDDNNGGTQQAFLDQFAVVYGKLLSRVTDGATLRLATSTVPNPPTLAPNVLPTPTPVTTLPQTPEVASRSACFSSVATVEVQGKGHVAMKSLEVGDYVLTPSGFEKVYTIDHRSDKEPTDFVQIYTELEEPLEVTATHLIYLHGKVDPVEAGTLSVGDELQTFIDRKTGSVAVEKVSRIRRNGFYNPITSSGTLVVDGLATSTYTAITVTDGSNYLVVGGYKVLSMHDFMHLAMGPFKTICMNVPKSISNKICSIAEGDEHNLYNKLGLKLMLYGKSHNSFVQNVIVMSLVNIFVMLNVLSNPIVLLILALMIVMKPKKTSEKNI